MKIITYQLDDKGSSAVRVGPMPDDVFAVNYAAIEQAACGEILVEEAPDAEPEPTQLDVIEAQVAYTAMMTGTLLEV